VLLYPVTFGHNSYAFNAHLNADGTPNEANVLATSVLDEMLENAAYRDLRDPYHLTQGGQLGRVHKGMRVIQLVGRLQVPDLTQEASLSDAGRLLRAAFDPYICYKDSPSTDGAYQLQFQEPTLDTATYATGRILLQYWARPVQQPFLAEKLDDAGIRAFRIALVAADPRVYEQSAQSLSTLTSGSVVNRGNTAAPLKATITMTGAGNAAFTINRGGVSFILNLSTMVNLDVVVVVFETCAPYGRGRYITKNGVENATLKTSAASTWLDAPVGSTTFTISNTGGVGSCVLAWYSARA
jgi:hypothetical protein